MLHELHVDPVTPASDLGSIRTSGPLAEPRPVARLSGAEARDYLRQRVLPKYPVVFTDVMQNAPAMTKWRPSFFESQYPDLTVEVAGKPVTMRDQLRHIMESSEERPAPYPFNFDIRKKTPELMKDLEPFISFGHSDRTVHPLMPNVLTATTTMHEVFFGGRGASYPILHYDILGMNTQITQVMGDKEFFFFDPSQTPYLYQDPLFPVNSKLNSIFTPDLERFPLFRHAKVLRVMLHEGETMYFPTGWWHVTRIHGPCITYGRAVVNASNWGLMMREDLNIWRRGHPVMALPAYALGNALGGLFNVMEVFH